MNHTNRLHALILGALGATALTISAVPDTAFAQEPETCPCSYASATRTRGFSGAEMRCVSEAVDVANVPPHGYENLKNRFHVFQRDRKGEIAKATRYFLFEQFQVAGPAETGGVVRIGPACMVTKAGKKRVSVEEAAYIFTEGEYTACAEDLTAFAQALMPSSSTPDGSCDDLDGNGVADEFEPMVPTPHYCFNEQGQPVACP